MTEVVLIPVCVGVAYVVASVIVSIADRLGLVYSPSREAKRHAGEDYRLAEHLRGGNP